MKMRSSGRHSKSIMEDDGLIIGFALELANGRWAPFDVMDRRLVDTKISFKNPNDVLKFFKMAADDVNGGPA